MYDGVESIGTEEVETITLDEFVRARSLYGVDVIKLDIEGGEYKALIGASEILKEYQPVLIIEVQEKALKMNGSTPEELESLLVQNGYRFWQIDGATAELQPIQSIAQSRSENVIAIHREHVQSHYSKEVNFDTF